MKLNFDTNTKLVDLTASQFGNLMVASLLHAQKKSLENIGEVMNGVFDSMIEHAPAMLDRAEEMTKLIDEKVAEKYDD